MITIVLSILLAIAVLYAAHVRIRYHYSGRIAAHSGARLIQANRALRKLQRDWPHHDAIVAWSRSEGVARVMWREEFGSEQPHEELEWKG